MLIKQKKAIISLFNKTVTCYKKSLGDRRDAKSILDKQMKYYGISEYHDKFCVFTPYWLIVIPEDIPEIKRCEGDFTATITHGLSMAKEHRGRLINYGEYFTVQDDIDRAKQWMKETSGAYRLDTGLRLGVNPVYWIALLTAFPDAYYYYPDEPKRPISFEDSKTGAYGLLMPCML